jgi:hypothetical protein
MAVLKQYLNARVTINYGGAATGYSDTGVLSYMDSSWVEVTKDKGDRLLVPIVAIRHIKLLESPRPVGDAAVLLRPSSGESPEREPGLDSIEP